MNGWSEWRPFPDPSKKDYLLAPFGPGVYGLRHKSTGKLILFGQSRNVAWRTSSLLPTGLGSGTRTNDEKREYVRKHLADIEYRTLACQTPEQAKSEEGRLRSNKGRYRFQR